MRGEATTTRKVGAPMYVRFGAATAGTYVPPWVWRTGASAAVAAACAGTQDAAASADAVVFIRGRVKFGVLRPNRRQAAASHPSALIGWNVDLRPCAHLGLLLPLESTSVQPGMFGGGAA